MRQAVTSLLALALASACGPSDQAPKFDPVTDQVGFVGSELSVILRASDPDADALTFSFSAPQIPDLGTRADIKPYGQDSSQAIFHWTPNARDVGVWIIDFDVTDGTSAVSESVTIEIKAAVGSNESPVFVQPLGSGSTLDLALARDIEINIVVEDPDNTNITIAQEAPIIDKAVLTVTGATSAKWRWQPTAAQIEARNVYALTLSADDGESPKTIKNYFIMLKKPPMTGCPGTAPVITHTSADVQAILAVPLTAQVTDDKGLKSGQPPVLYWSLTAPAMPINVGMMQAVPATLKSGDMKSGSWQAEVPNPVASMPAGSSATVYYLWSAVDNDDESGDCDHTTLLPASDVFHMKVTNPGGSGNLMPCDECSADVQCGGSADNCLRISGGMYCGKACAGDPNCPTDFQCSAADLTSVNGAMARQCVPKSGSCTMITPTMCVDDDKEDNDTRAQAAAKPALDFFMSYMLKMCPLSTTGVDIDWFKFEAPDEGDITVSIAGGSAADLDLQLVDPNGVPIDTAAGNGSNESVRACVTPGTYFVQVYSGTAMPSAVTNYTLSFIGQSNPCTPVEACVDDSGENADDLRTTATDQPVHLQDKVEVKGRQICSNDSDFYKVQLKKDEMFYATLAFEQIGFEDDLDLHFWDNNTDLTPCNDTTPCTPATGQSADSNENYMIKVPHDGNYFVEVKGYQWDGFLPSENSYDLCVSVMSGKCPALP